uniref:Putative ribonuclease H-like domain-containing protein n=1 Tax=Tanacetum cinerariifolium TaxID=118510 RepID=A0A6L2KAA9_TANCI|nr:putative ribonuclease H-like domain-containing protein [Tanacetum cinerariifolium]
MCDKKNNVLFTYTECVVLSSDFKLPDENYVLLRVPRENDMYNVDLKNVVPSGYLTCLFAKATLEKFNLWHRRLGHINFKTMNKLVKGNLVRGLPSKIFENNHTCVVCQKGKQHRASYKSKPIHGYPSPFRLRQLIQLETNISVSPIPTTRVHKDHPVTQIISDLTSVPQTKSITMMVKEQGGLHQINDEDFHTCKRAIGSKWVFKNKKDKRGIMIKNKARLVAHGHTQEEGIDYDEVFALVSRIEAIRLFLAYASFMGFMVYQMDVKSAFLYRTFEEKVYVFQPLGFKDHGYPDKVYMVVKALYGLYQALRAWYGTFTNYLQENGFQRGKIDQTLFIKKQKGDILLVQVYVDDIIFRSTNKELCKAFEKLMKDKFQMRKPLLKDPDGEDVDVHIYSKELASPKQTALGKDISNPFMAGSLPKIIW